LKSLYLYSTKIALATGATTINQSYVYDNSSVVTGNSTTRVKSLAYDKVNGLSFTYSYDNLNNISEIIVKENGEQVEKYNFEYDGLNQLVREDVNIQGSLTTKDFTMVYEYDQFGNILSKKKYTYHQGTLTGTPVVISYEYSTTWKDQLVKFNGKVITYDDLGNPTKIATDATNYVSLSWDGRQLVNYTEYVNSVEKQTVSYKYNDQGIRTYKKVETDVSKYTEYYYYLDGDKVLYEKINTVNGTKTITDKLYYTYDMDGRIISVNYNGTEYFYIRNDQNDVVKIVDANGIEVVKYTYDAWGNILEQTDNTLAKLNPYRYRGYRYDEETSLYYLNSRYYNAEMGRFINADGTLGGTGDVLGHNMYAYAHNNPVMKDDPSGYWPKWTKSVAKIAANVAVGIVVGAAVGAITACSGGLGTAAAVAVGGALEGVLTNGIENAIDGKPFFQGSGKAAAIGAVSAVVGFGIGKGVAKAFGRACFTAGTLVKTKDGDKNIEDIKEGDLVYAENPETGEKGLRKVVRTFVYEKKEIIKIKVNGKEISTTAEHPFYVPEKGWTKAVDLRAGDQLKLINGEIVTIEFIQHELLESPIIVYNFEVEEFHTYYVSESGVLVHNTCGGVLDNAAETVNKVDDNAAEGIVYLRTNLETGKQYVGQAKNTDRYLKRQLEHAAKNNAEYSFKILDNATPGRSTLDVLEQRMINQYGGLNILENRRNQIATKYWDKFGIK
jgi:RHS repeat-associated protein